MSYIIVVQQYMARLRKVIISNDITCKVLDITAIGIITRSGTCRRTGSICQRTWGISGNLKWCLIWNRAPCLIIQREKSPTTGKSWRNRHILWLMSSNRRISTRNIGCRRYKHPMPCHLTNQNADVPTEHAYLNQELAPLTLCGNNIGLPLPLIPFSI